MVGTQQGWLESENTEKGEGRKKGAPEVLPVGSWEAEATGSREGDLSQQSHEAKLHIHRKSSLKFPNIFIRCHCFRASNEQHLRRLLPSDVTRDPHQSVPPARTYPPCSQTWAHEATDPFHVDFTRDFSDGFIIFSPSMLLSLGCLFLLTEPSRSPLPPQQKKLRLRASPRSVLPILTPKLLF